MFGNIFFKKNELPSTLDTTKNIETLAHNTPEYFKDVNDFVQIEKEQGNIRLRQNGIDESIASMFTVPEQLQQKTSTLNESEPVSEEYLDKELQEEHSSHEINVSSESELVVQVKNEYAASVFFDKACDVLTRRGVSAENMPLALEHVFTKMAQKCIESFKGEMLQILFAYDLDEFDAENYIYWRLNEYTENNPLYLTTDDSHEKLVAENFVSDVLIERFHAREDAIVGTPEEQDAAQDIVTSEKIDSLLDEINTL
jgi:hypothetical protein